MDWFQQIDIYCERVGPAFWAEPLNAISNAAFLIGALVAFRLHARERAATGRADWGALLLTLILFAIGIGSFLFHTFANAWSSAADVIPILLYILVYLYLANVRYLGLPWWAAALIVLAFLPISNVGGGLLTQILGDLNGSEAYVPTFLAVLIYGLILLPRQPVTGRGLIIGAAILGVSITARTLDDQNGALCAAFPLGIHYLWHILNGVMLTWMIWVLLRHARLARAGAAG
ncbi:MAG: ceramidase domain-containing protein [Pseudomonadota bacterium]